MITAICFIAVGVLLFAAVSMKTWQTHAFIRAVISAHGSVIDLQRQGRGYITVFNFSDAEGNPHVAQTSFSVNPIHNQIGADITVLYLPGHPDTVRIKSFYHLWLLPTILGSSGIAFTVMGIITLIAGRKTYRAK